MITTIYVLIAIAVIVFLVLFSSRNYEFKGVTITKVNAPLHHTFAEAMNEEHMKEWLSSKQMQLESVENISGSKNEIGSEWKLTYRERGNRKLEMVETVTDFVENEKFSFDLVDKMFNFHIDMLFRADGDHSTIEERATGQGRTWMSNTMLRSFGNQAKKMKEGMYQKLKEIIERTYNQAN